TCLVNDVEPTPTSWRSACKSQEKEPLIAFLRKAHRGIVACRHAQDRFDFLQRHTCLNSFVARRVNVMSGTGPNQVNGNRSQNKTGQTERPEHRFSLHANLRRQATKMLRIEPWHTVRIARRNFRSTRDKSPRLF